MLCRSRVGAFAAFLGVAALMASAQGSAQPTPRQPELKIEPGSGAGYTSWARSDLSAPAGVQLKLTKFEKSYGGHDYSFIGQCPGWSAVPDQVSAGSKASFCYGSFHPPSGVFQVDTGFFFYYDILIPNRSGGWMPSGYYVDGATKVPLFGDPVIDCTIKVSGDTGAASGAPFKCATSFTGSGNDSQPHWTVTANPVTEIDASTSANVEKAAKLIGENCIQFDTPRCTWTRTQKSSAFLPERSEWQSLTNWADSCPPTDPNRLFVLNTSRSVQISWSDKVGGKIAAKVAGDVFVVKVEGTVEASYEHSITQTDTYGESYTYTIPYNFRSALFLQHGLLEVTGDFSIITAGGERFLVKNAVFRFPLQREVTVEGRGQPVPRGVVQHVDIPCSQEPPSHFDPPPANATVGLAVPESP